MRIYFLIILVLYKLGASAQEEESQYADILIDAGMNSRHNQTDKFYGGFDKFYPIAVKPEVVLGHNRYFLSLPKGSYVVVSFTDNEVIDFPGKDDLFISEVGCSGEHANVFVSTNGIHFEFLGRVDDCEVSSLDLGSIGYKDPVRYVKIVGLDSKGGSPGFDLVSVMGLPNSNKKTYASMDTIISLEHEEVKDKKFILENIFFETNSHVLLPTSTPSLNDLAGHLKSHPDISIHISGHTDSIGTAESNLKLSNLRAKSVKDYLIEQGIDSMRITFEGKGETMPLKSNDTEEGRMKNRRVEFQIIGRKD